MRRKLLPVIHLLANHRVTGFTACGRWAKSLMTTRTKTDVTCDHCRATTAWRTP